MTVKPTFSVETSCGEDSPTIHLYFGDGVRVQIADSIAGFGDFFEHIGNVYNELLETYPEGI